MNGHGDPVEGIHDAVTRLASTDIETLSDVELDDELVLLMAAKHRIDAEVARRAAAWADRGGWSSDGSRSPAARLSRDANVPVEQARKIIGRGRAVSSMPATGAAWSEGTISTAHVDLLRSARTGRDDTFDRDEAVLVDGCKHLRYAEASKAVAYWRRRVDAEANVDGSPPPPESYCSVARTFDGAVTGTFVLDPVGGEAFVESLRRIEDELYHRDQRDGVVRSKTERRAAALVEMAIRAHAMPGDAKTPDPLVTILAGEASVEHVLELATGTVISPATVVPYLDAATVQTFIFDGADRVLAASKCRTFRGMLRRAIQVRDRHCQHHSGCDVPLTECDVDHVVPFRERPISDEQGGRLQCSTHNRHEDRHSRPPAVIIGLARERRMARRQQRDLQRQPHQEHGPPEAA